MGRTAEIGSPNTIDLCVIESDIWKGVILIRIKVNVSMISHTQVASMAREYPGKGAYGK
jgi:hypothetical protein